MAAFNDTNRLHTDDEYARSRGFEAKVVHGAILTGFVSHFVGVCFPGGNCLLHSVEMQYKTPSHVGDEIRLDAVVTQIVESLQVLVMKITLVNLTRGRVAARAQLQVGCT